MTGIEGAAQPDPNPADYVILEPGKLIVTYLTPGEHYDEKKIPASRLLSVVRFMNEVSLDSEKYKPVLASIFRVAGVLA